MGGKKNLIAWNALFAVFLVMVIVLNCTALYWSQALLLFFGTTGGRNNLGDRFPSRYGNDEELRSAQEQIVREIVDEGTILLENDGTLPLTGREKVTILGQTSVDWIRSGVGSSAMDNEFYSKSALKKSLEDVGFSVNNTVWEYYLNSGKTKGSGGSGMNAEWSLNETAWTTLKSACGASFSGYNDVAVLVIGRLGAEGSDLPREMSRYDGKASESYLELSETEKGLLRGAHEAGFQKIIVLLNTCNAMQMDFVQMPDLGVNACISFGGTGANGIEEVGKILKGIVNPSGHLVDTYLLDNFDSPAMQNFGDLRYVTAGGELVGDRFGFINYAEGIYVGYKYYETRYEDKVMGTGNAGDFDYSTSVAYPFGYGLSYTTFQFDQYSLQDNGDGTLSVHVTVTNTGNVAGKDVVEIYFQAPYTDYDRTAGVEKASVNLVDFAKTGVIEPGKFEDVTVTFNIQDVMKSYDANHAKGYIMDEGDYYITAAQDAHEAVNHFLAAKGYSTAHGTTDAGNPQMVGTYQLDSFTNITADSLTGTAVTNQFDDAVAADGVYLSRSDWSLVARGLSYATGTMVGVSYSTDADKTVQTRVADEQLIENLKNINWKASGIPDAAVDHSEAVYDTAAGLTLEDLLDADYADPRWDTLIGQMKISELHSLYNKAGYSTQEIESIGKPRTFDYDGPLGFTSYVNGWNSFAYPAENVRSATWNTDVQERFGELVGEDGLRSGISGWYAPAMNIHRTPFSGRNYEYYSEDAVLSGKTGAAEVRGCRSKGLNTYIKHFVANDQETERNSLATWLQEQAFREIYLKPFELAVKEGGTNALMASMNRIGYRFTRGSYALLTTVLRDEWGFKGAVITDFTETKNEYSDMALAAGVDLQLDTSANSLSDTKAPEVRHALQRAAKNTCYMVANSAAMQNDSSGGFPVYMLILIAIDVAAIAGLAVAEMLAVRSYKRGPVELTPGQKRKRLIICFIIIVAIVFALVVASVWAYSYIVAKQI